MTAIETLVSQFAADRGIDISTFRKALLDSAFKYVPSVTVTDSHIERLLASAKALGVDPLTGEIRANLRDGTLSVFLTVDGYLRVANDHPQMDGLEIEYADELADVVSIENGNTVRCPSWIGVKIYRKDRRVPYSVREYLDEVQIRPIIAADGRLRDSSWHKMPKKLLTNRAVCSAVRFAFGIGAGLDLESEEPGVQRSEAAPVRETKKARRATAKSDAKPAEEKKSAAEKPAASDPVPASLELPFPEVSVVEQVADPAPAPAAEPVPVTEAAEVPAASEAAPEPEVQSEPAPAQQAEPQSEAPAEEKPESADQKDQPKKGLSQAQRTQYLDGVITTFSEKLKKQQITLEQAQRWVQHNHNFLTPHEQSSVLARLAMAAVNRG